MICEPPSPVTGPAQRRRRSRAPSGVSRTSQPSSASCVADRVGAIEVALAARAASRSASSASARWSSGPRPLREQRLEPEQAEQLRERLARAAAAARRLPSATSSNSAAQRPRGVEVVGERVEERLAPARRRTVVLAGARPGASARIVADPLDPGPRLGRARPRRTRAAGGSGPRSGRRPRPRAPKRSSASESWKMLPTDFDIFSSSVWTIPLCIQIRARGEPAGGLGLGDLVLVMGEDEVGAAAVDREVGAELGFSAIAEHSMCQPGRPSPQGESQARVLARLARLPEREVERVLLELGAAGLLALVHLVGVAVRELAVAVEAADPEVDVTPGLVGVPALDQRLDQRDDLGDRLGRQRLGVGAAEAERARCPRRRRRSSRAASSAEAIPALARRGVDLVVDVGDVDDERRLVALVLEEPAQQA